MEESIEMHMGSEGEGGQQQGRAGAADMAARSGFNAAGLGCTRGP